jgi:hypothetical protein
MEFCVRREVDGAASLRPVLPGLSLVCIDFPSIAGSVTAYLRPQSFISAAGGNKKLVTILEHIEDIVEKLEKLQIDVEKVEAETANIDVVNADKVEADEIKET